ncbi:type IX secretion system membrane protein PorP/SprF, partial [Lishizhenia sp.]|uniref:PorP/SprF family type IX secretion system membrane protein n=1 Tax=Lishizhenia sp. TaxID=2497594 RepID=UPI00299CF4EB
LKFKKSRGRLAMGLKFGMNLMNARTNELLTTEGNDPQFMTNAGGIISPNFGFGMYYYSKRVFVGFSTPRMLESRDFTSLNSNYRRHYFFIAGYVFDVDRNLKIRPNTQVKLTEGAPVSFDLGVSFIFNDKLWLGGNYRLGDSFGVITQFQLNNQFKVGLAYDITTNELAAYNKGTFEVLLSYDFSFKKSGIRSPRYF